jgi:hypothetical protein
MRTTREPEDTRGKRVIIYARTSVDKERSEDGEKLCFSKCLPHTAQRHAVPGRFG